VSEKLLEQDACCVSLGRLLALDHDGKVKCAGKVIGGKNLNTIAAHLAVD
jgi:hypothetical protein